MNKKLKLGGLLLLAAFVLIFAGCTDAGYEDLGGTLSVSNANGLKEWANRVNNGEYTLNCTLVGNIDMQGVSWTPVGSSSTDEQYNGTFDGNGNTITGLTINSSADYAGLIGYLGSEGKVQDLTLYNVNITSSNNHVGGVVGYNDGGTVTACAVSSGTISGGTNVGGVVGYNAGTVIACYNAEAAVSGTLNVGGVVGTNADTLTACYSASTDIDGRTYAGGVVGLNNGGTVTACYWSNYSGNGIGNTTNSGSGSATQVSNWSDAVDGMNNALGDIGWRYELSDDLPTLTKLALAEW